MIDLPQTPSFDLSGKNALVTGASSGIGLGCAAALAGAGAHVVCAARGRERLDDAVGALGDKGWSAEGLTLDQSDLEQLGDLAKSRVFDIVVNSAGLARHGLALETEPGDFDAVIDVNLRSAYFLSSWCAGAMIKAGKGGSIIHISSQMGHVGGTKRAVYCASKHAIEGMVKAMAIEWGKKGVRINTVCPTFIRTPFTERVFQDKKQVAWLMENIQLERIGNVEDVMGAVLYLASPASAMVTGSAMLVDGGWTAA